MLEVNITKHAKKRIKERLGIPKRGFQRLIKSVITLGTFLDISKIEKNVFYVFHNKYRYIFAKDERLNLQLITVVHDSELSHCLIDHSKNI